MSQSCCSSTTAPRDWWLGNHFNQVCWVGLKHSGQWYLKNSIETHWFSRFSWNGWKCWSRKRYIIHSMYCRESPGIAKSNNRWAKWKGKELNLLRLGGVMKKSSGSSFFFLQPVQGVLAPDYSTPHSCDMNQLATILLTSWMKPHCLICPSFCCTVWTDERQKAKRFKQVPKTQLFF